MVFNEPISFGIWYTVPEQIWSSDLLIVGRSGMHIQMCSSSKATMFFFSVLDERVH